MSNPKEFAAWMTPYAIQASQATGLDVGLIIAQWGNEVGWGTEFAEKNNIGNVGVYPGGPNPSYATLQEGVNAYIQFVNSNSDMAKVKAVAAAGGSLAAQAQALGASGYASGQYNNGGGPGSSLIADAQEAGVAGDGAASGSDSSFAAVQPGGSSPGGTAAATTTAVTGTTPANTPDSTNIGGVSYNGTEQQTDALSTLAGDLSAYGFTPPQVKQLTNWAWGEITNNVDPTQVAIDLQTQPAFIAQFPGFGPANAELAKSGLQAVSVTQYMQYQTQAEAMAQAAGLPAGFINKEDIGQLVGHNVSTTELSARMNDAVALAYNSPPDTTKLFNQYFGTQYAGDTLAGEPNRPANNDNGHGPLTRGQIAALILDPNKAEPLIHQQITAAQIGGAGVTAGVGAISGPLALHLAQSGVTQSAALSGFQQIAPLAPLEKGLPGLGGQYKEAKVDTDTLAVSQFLGGAGATRAVQLAQEVRKAPFTGGGGFTTGSRGSSVGGANVLGPTQPNS